MHHCTVKEEKTEKVIISLLRERGRMTTREIDKEVQKEKECPDSTARLLMKLRHEGKIKGEISVERRGWIWWVE